MANKTFRKKGGTKNRNGKSKKNLKKTHKRYKMKGGAIKYTDNKKIAIDTNDENILYVKQDYLPELKKQNPFIYKYLKKIGTHKFNGAIYVKLESTIEFYNVKNEKGIGDSPKTIKDKKQKGAIENDCVGVTEKCVVKDLSANNSDFPLTAVDNDTFGLTHFKNLKIANTIKLNKIHKSHNINPEIGEGYVTIRRAEEKGKCPYHGACVIFKDGNSNITLEADAGNKDLKKPIFDLYTSRRTKGKSTFHDKHKKGYTSKGLAPVTSILKPIKRERTSKRIKR